MAAVLFRPFSVDQPLNKITMKAQRKVKSPDYFISSSRYACVRCITLNLFLYKIMLYFDLSGWFDSFTFKRWFFDLFLLSVVDKDGPIFLFGDNLGSHLNADLVKLAKENSIHFVMLPANATNWIQVLDMSVFGPMKLHGTKFWEKWWQETQQTGDIPKKNISFT